jgi:pilus assembly protein Flp/PilA
VIAIRTILRRLFADRRGATAIEYGLIASLIIVAMIGGLSALGGGAGGMWTKIEGKVSDPRGKD